jgi:hypothetical protein
MTGFSLAAAAMLAVTAAAPPAPLQPSGKWLVEGQDNMCALSHAYGEGKEAVTLGFRPWPTGDMVDVIWFSHTMDSSVRDGTAQIRFEAGESPAISPYTSFALAGRGERLSSFTISQTMLPYLERSRTVTVTFDGKTAATVAPSGVKAALAALSSCETLLYASLGVDPTFRSRVASPATPKGSERSWFGPKDYPPEAVHGGAQGRTLMLLTIDVDGRISKCVPFGRSGNAAIDKASCGTYTRRGRFNPAIGKDGQPMVSYYIGRVHWTLGL